MAPRSLRNLGRALSRKLWHKEHEDDEQAHPRDDESLDRDSTKSTLLSLASESEIKLANPRAESVVDEAGQASLTMSGTAEIPGSSHDVTANPTVLLLPPSNDEGENLDLDVKVEIPSPGGSTSPRTSPTQFNDIQDINDIANHNSIHDNLKDPEIPFLQVVPELRHDSSLTCVASSPATSPQDQEAPIKASPPPPVDHDPAPVQASIAQESPSCVRIATADLKRGQSLLSREEGSLFKALLHSELDVPAAAPDLHHIPLPITASMVNRKIWVKRPNASATLVSIHEDDLVDDVRDMVLRKYANSLGRSFDAPDVVLRIVTREQRQDRILGPEESIARLLDKYFPGGQTVEEALLIDVPPRKTPRPSPRVVHYEEQGRPAEAGTDYFPPMPVAVPSHSPSVSISGAHHAPPHAMSILTTGTAPALPSPGGVSRRLHRDRPRMGRTHTTSPQSATAPTSNPGTAPLAPLYATRAVGRARTHSSASDKSAVPPMAPALPTPPPQQPDLIVQRVATPPPRVSSPRPAPTRPRKTKRATAVEHPSLPTGMLNNSVPPINVLIVEDNIINLKLLEAFMKRLKVRCQTAINGREAVTKWRSGGFHLVLMDIQLPIMSGLEATKEIRRLERLNNIGVFSSSASSSAPDVGEDEEPGGEDVLPVGSIFKSPVIIVALTASSLQSDRHGALAAGCNDFLTKVRLYDLHGSRY